MGHECMVLAGSPLTYALVFLAGGYLINALNTAVHVFVADRRADDAPTVGESVVTAVLVGITWPLMAARFEAL